MRSKSACQALFMDVLSFGGCSAPAGYHFSGSINDGQLGVLVHDVRLRSLCRGRPQGAPRRPLRGCVSLPGIRAGLCKSTPVSH